MPELSRRGFLGAATAATGAAVVGVVLPAADAQASAAPAVKPRRHGDIRDIKHVVILMQENRSFDHYFGSLRGVRGFGDRSTITLPGGLPVFQQPTTLPGTPVTTTQFPWHLSDAPASAYPAGHQPPSSEVGAQGYGGTSHSWDDQHGAWYGGLMNGWVFAKGGLTTLGYLDRTDIPFHYALADAYTIGDAYHCSVLSATGPNRTYLWSGTIDAQQKFSNFVAFNGGDELGKFLLWETYAETLQKAGVTLEGLPGSGRLRRQRPGVLRVVRPVRPDSGRHACARQRLVRQRRRQRSRAVDRRSANADNLANAIKADVVAGTLPQVSWVVTNQAFSEHPDGAPNDGAYYVNSVLEALNADPDVFNSTLVIIDYDENDGQFDHVPPPVPAPGTTDEFYFEASGGLASFGVTQPMPVGLGFRVPLILISPWTRGGWVTSEVSDHTSVIQFLEKWTEALGAPAICPNISAWRRSVCGDLTGAFDFESPVFGLPALPATTVIGDPAGGSYRPPVTTNAMPKQEPGTKRARPLPYQPNANLDGFTFGSNGAVEAQAVVQQQRAARPQGQPLRRLQQRRSGPGARRLPGEVPGAVHGRAVAHGLEQDRAGVGRDRRGRRRRQVRPDRCRSEPFPAALHRRRERRRQDRAGGGGLLRRRLQSEAQAHADADQQRREGRHVHGRVEQLLEGPGEDLPRARAWPRDAHGRAVRVQPWMVRPVRHDQRRRLVVAALHRPPRGRYEQRHRLTGRPVTDRRVCTTTHASWCRPSCYARC